MQPSILHVDDDENDLFLLRHAAARSNLGVPVVSLACGHEAIRYLAGEGPYSDRFRSPIPCLVLLDFKMPRLSGLDVLRWIRKRSEFSTLIVIILSSSAIRRDIEQAMTAGANAFVTKSGHPGELVSFLNSLKAFWLTFHEFPWPSECKKVKELAA